MSGPTTMETITPRVHAIRGAAAGAANGFLRAGTRKHQAPMGTGRRRGSRTATHNRGLVRTMAFVEGRPWVAGLVPKTNERMPPPGGGSKWR